MNCTIDVITNKKKFFQTKNLFICCGPISTATLMLRSNLVKNNNIVLQGTLVRFVVVPIFKRKNTKNSVDQNKNTLAEIFLEISNDQISKKSIHLQYYTLCNGNGLNHSLNYLVNLCIFFQNYFHLFLGD